MYSSTFQEVTIHQQIIRHGRLVRSNARRFVVGNEQLTTGVLQHPPLYRRSVRAVRRLRINAESNDLGGLCAPVRRRSTIIVMHVPILLEIELERFRIFLRKQISQ
jgi:hypothetical protein